MARTSRRLDPALAACEAGVELARGHPLLAPLLTVARVRLERTPGVFGREAWVRVEHDGRILLNARRRGEPEAWLYGVAHALLHLGFGHFRPHPRPALWLAACDLVVARFLDALRLGRHPDGVPLERLPELGADEAAVSRALEVRPEFLPALQALSLNGPAPDMVGHLIPWEKPRYGQQVSPEECLARGLRAAVSKAVQVAGGALASMSAAGPAETEGTRARRWLIDHYPLVGALAASFDLIEDAETCRRHAIRIAAVDISGRTVYLNPASGLSTEESRFVLAHEFLHAGLRHEARCRGRDHFLWNCACDFLINDWLIEAGVGRVPDGLLYDPALKGESAETVYDRLAKDLRRASKLATLRGTGFGDIIDDELGRGPTTTDLDAFYRQCLTHGLAVHLERGRGLLPAGLVEEVRALGQPPLPWDVALGRWLSGHVPPREAVRTYARPSRRQGASPDVPRPRLVPVSEREHARTFGVVLDTSGSMDNRMLGKGIGAVASFALARDVPGLRLVFCDAAPHDAGYVDPAGLLDRVAVRGRGGTVLQPAVDLLLAAPDFPKDAPVLIVTDGFCDRLTCPRPHAFLVPAGHRLPFLPKGPVFEMN